MTKRNISILVSLILLVLAGGDWLVWRAAEARLAQGFAQWQAAARTQGWQVATGTARRGGWPVAARLTIPNFVIAGGERLWPGGSTWRAEQVVLGISPIHPMVLQVQPWGEQVLAVSGMPPLHIAHDSMVLRIGLRGATGLDMSAAGLRIDAGATETAMAELTAHLDTPAPDAGIPMRFALRAEVIDLPPGRPWPLGPRISSLSLDLSVTGRVGDRPELAGRAAAWRDSGGMLDIQHLALGWGTLGINGSAKIGLDATMQPAGTGLVHLLGAAETLDTLGTAGVIPPRTAMAARALMLLMVQTPEGGAPEVALPVTLKDGVVLAGQFPVAKVPMIDWARF